MSKIEKKTAISVFNYYNINPTNTEELRGFDYRKIKKIKITKTFKGEIKMNNATLITKETPAPQMSFIERETIRLNSEIEELKNKLGTTEISEDEYKKSLNKKGKQNVIDSYNEQIKIKESITKLEKKLLNLEPFQAGIDVGKYNTKLTYVPPSQGELTSEYGNFTTDIFESRVQRATECRHDGGKKFFVGRELYSTSGAAKRVSDRNVIVNENIIEPMNNTKAHEYHRILLLKALYNIYLKTGRQVFDVGVGTSIDNYIEDNGAKVYLTMLDEKLPTELQVKVDSVESKKEKNEIYKAYVEELKAQFISKEFVVRETGGEPVTIVINDLYIAPETVTGATMIDVDDLAHAYVIDIGGLNESFLPIVNFAPIFDHIITNKNGMAHKYEEIANWLVSKSSEVTAMDRDGVEVILNNRDTMLDVNTEESIKDYMRIYFDEVTDKLKRNKVALKEGVTTLIFIGGGSQVLAPYIKDYYTNVCDMKGKVHIAEKDGIYSNVTGIYEAAANYFDDRKYLRQNKSSEAC